MSAASIACWCPASSIVLSVKCGGSDYTSGLASNPVVGRVADRLVDVGGAGGAGRDCGDHGRRTPAGGARIVSRGRRAPLRVVNRVEAEAIALGLDIRGTQPSPGNIRGGLTTIEEKSLGATHKAGERTRLEEVVPYASRVSKPGLTVMDTPGLDVESVTGMVGGGAQVVVFHDRPRDADRKPGGPGDQDHRQRAHRRRAWRTISTSTSAA
jgi:altronate dehydratase large subunit